MLTFLGIIVLVIFVHELGHYAAARACGVAVDSFSIGFGKVLLKKELWGTEWRFVADTLRWLYQTSGRE